MKRNPSPILSVDNLATAAKNAQNEAVQSVCLSFGNSLYLLDNAQIIPQRNHSDLVLFAGTPIQKEAVTPIKSYLSFLAGAKPAPLHKTITPAVIAIISQLIDKADLNALYEIKTALSEVNEHFEIVDYKKSLDNQYPCDFKFGGAL